MRKQLIQDLGALLLVIGSTCCGFTGGEQLAKKDLIISNPDINEEQKVQEVSDLRRSYTTNYTLSAIGLAAGALLYTIGCPSRDYQKKD